MSIEIRLFGFVFVFDFGFTEIFIKLCCYEIHIQRACGKFHLKPDFETTKDGFNGNWLKLDFVGSKV